MKYLDRLILHHLKASPPPCFDQHQFAYRANGSTETPSPLLAPGKTWNLLQDGFYEFYRVSSIRYLGVHIVCDLTCAANTPAVPKKTTETQFPQITEEKPSSCRTAVGLLPIHQVLCSLAAQQQTGKPCRGS
ncbi:hypothetical protein GOODEAATRI_020031 [Goodea atripinnis]|uniref:Uncharacterized protein n=1 Tax=Goodea atripinnis TaxID=208336 RepID=A0ABV0N493_9TELE